MASPAYSSRASTGPASPAVSASRNNQSAYQSPSFAQPLGDNDMQSSRTNVGGTVRRQNGENSSLPAEKSNNVHFVQSWARHYSAKEGAAIVGMTPNGFKKVQLGESSISFDRLVQWCKNDPDFAAAYAAHVGLILPGDAGFAGALTKAVQAYQRRGE